MTLDLLREIIVKNYDINSITNIEKTSSGSGNTFYVSTTSEKYIAKLNERQDFVLLYDKIEPVLTKYGHNQSKIIRTNNNGLMTSESIVLYTFLSGDVHEKLNNFQTENAILYLKQFNADLSAIVFSPTEIHELNSWDKVKSIDFLINHFNYTELPLELSDILLIRKAIQILADRINFLSVKPKQLIHSDLGPDNIIFKNNDVYSIIDFTPEYENEIYSLCQFCYWNHFWILKDNENVIDNWLRIYHQKHVSKSEKELFYTLLVKAALCRVAGALMAGNLNINKRFEILNRTIIIYECTV